MSKVAFSSGVAYVVQRILILIPLMVLMSMLIFAVIQAPPGDYLDLYIANAEAGGSMVTPEEAARLRIAYGLDKSLPEQYFIWIRNIVLRGDFGLSLIYQKPVLDLVGERLALTAFITLATSVFIWVVSLPIGVYSACNQYSILDYFWTFVGFIGMATPNFLLALGFLWVAFSKFGISTIGLMSPEFQYAPLSLAKIWDLFKHLWIPVFLIGSSGTAGFIRVVRGTLLDELNRQYVITARAKGLKERRLLFKYPVRVVLNPMISTIGWMLPGLLSGEVLVSIVLNIPTTGPLLLQALMAQDMFLAGGIVLLLSLLTLIGTLISDIALVLLDPRIRYGRIAAR